MIDFADEAKESFLALGEPRRLYVVQNALHQIFITQQFRRDRGVRLRSKRAVIQAGRIAGDQFADTGRQGRRFTKHFLGEPFQMRSGRHLERKHVQDLRVFWPGPTHHVDGLGVIVV